MRLMKTAFRLSSVAILALAAAALVRLFFAVEVRAYDAEEAPMVPAFTHTAAADWINSPPLSWAGLKGQVVLLDVWTFDCWNCYRSIPWVRTLEDRFGAQGFRVVGVHTPEFDNEKVRANVEAKVKEFGVRGSVMLDNDYSYWNALQNQYWPAFYVVDRQGRLRGRYVGETHAGDERGLRVEQQITALLGEPR